MKKNTTETQERQPPLPSQPQHPWQSWMSPAPPPPPTMDGATKATLLTMMNPSCRDDFPLMLGTLLLISLVLACLEGNDDNDDDDGNDNGSGSGGSRPPSPLLPVPIGPSGIYGGAAVALRPRLPGVAAPRHGSSPRPSVGNSSIWATRYGGGASARNAMRRTPPFGSNSCCWRVAATMRCV